MSEFIGTKLTMNLGERSYDIILKSGALENLYQFARLDRRVAVVTDSGVPAQYAQRVADQCREAKIITVPQGEASKSFKILETVLRQMLEFNMGRGDLVVAVGGGVVGDLAGFAAAIYMRGIDFINCPTTTLSMIDSSIGGKTAVDLGDTKNIVGAFWQPKLVIVDPDTLSTLPRRHFINGLAEAVKASLLADPELFAIFENGDVDAQIGEIICRSLRFKKNIVEQDETEQGMRKALNFGHTIGHAIERAFRAHAIHAHIAGRHRVNNRDVSLGARVHQVLDVLQSILSVVGSIVGNHDVTELHNGLLSVTPRRTNSTRKRLGLPL